MLLPLSWGTQYLQQLISSIIIIILFHAGDPVEFLSWFMNAMHLSLGGTRKAGSSYIYKTFQGRMKVYSRKVLPMDISEKEKKELLKTEEYKGKVG